MHWGKGAEGRELSFSLLRALGDFSSLFLSLFKTAWIYQVRVS
jgi:hypothetical protein